MLVVALIDHFGVRCSNSYRIDNNVTHRRPSRAIARTRTYRSGKCSAGTCVSEALQHRRNAHRTVLEVKLHAILTLYATHASLRYARDTCPALYESSRD